ncbi:arginase [Clostridium sp. 19966]|uniref:arginase n=1 Tax=Clostridium sp. 19966 TaxID=2768166 RepID=UPI0028E0891B|nr:arginase [Clostridium sp. 19966]MDT8718093.1 arginase [Clostridium sp. 19966]
MNINLIGVPIFFGSDRKGVDEGPDKLRSKNVAKIIEKHGNNVYDLGNLHVRKLDENLKFSSHKKMKYIDEILEVNTNLAHQVYCSLKANCFPFVIGGDHSLGLGSISGSSKFYDNLGVIWIDAHGDINTHETTPSGNVHGMPLASAMGFGFEKLVNLYYSGPKIKKENVFIIGARDLDEGELAFIKKLNLNVWTTKAIKENGIKNTVEDVISRIRKRNLSNIHLSLDIDVLDKNLVPGTGTPVRDGLNVDETKNILEALISTKLIRSMDVVEFNPLLDEKDETLNNTLELIDCCFSYL